MPILPGLPIHPVKATASIHWPANCSLYHLNYAITYNFVLGFVGFVVVWVLFIYP